MQLRHGTLAKELLRNLCDKFASRRPGVWSLSIDAEMPGELPDSWHDEGTIRGEFLQQMEAIGVSDAMPLDMECFRSSENLAGELATALRIGNSRERHRVLTRATQFGADLLSGEEF